MKISIKYFFAVLLTLKLTMIPFVNCFSQDEGPNDIVGDSLVDISTVGAIGAGGAILGLSTLSFADKPGDHLKNIWIGASIGVIVGVAFVAWSQATESQGAYNSAYKKPSNIKSFNTYSRQAWHNNEQKMMRKKLKVQAPLVVGSFSF